MPRLIWVFAGCTAILLVLSCRGSKLFAYKAIPDVCLTMNLIIPLSVFLISLSLNLIILFATISHFICILIDNKVGERHWSGTDTIEFHNLSHTPTGKEHSQLRRKQMKHTSVKPRRQRCPKRWPTGYPNPNDAKVVEDKTKPDEQWQKENHNRSIALERLVIHSWAA